MKAQAPPPVLFSFLRFTPSRAVERVDWYRDERGTPRARISPHVPTDAELQRLATSTYHETTPDQ